MWCPNCGVELGEESISFCPQCGCNIETGEVSEVASSLAAEIRPVSAPSLPKVNWTKKHTIISIVIIGLLAVTYFGYSLWLKPKTAQETALDFAEALKKQDYNTAYDSLYCADSKLLNEERFAGIFKEYGTIQDFKIEYPGVEPDNGKDSAQSVDCIITFDLGNRGNDACSMQLKKVYEGKKGIWKVVWEDIYQDYRLHINGNRDVKVLADNIGLTLDNNGDAGFTSFCNAPLEIKIEGQDIEPLTIKLPEGENEIHNINLQPSSAVQSSIQKLVNDFNQADIAATRDLNEQAYQPYIKAESEMWESMHSRIEGMKSNGYHMNYVLENIEYLEAGFTEEGYIQIKARETWNGTRIYLDGSTYEQGSNTATNIYTAEKQTDGNWLLIDHYNTWF